MFLFLLTFMGAAVFEKYDDRNNVHPLVVRGGNRPGRAGLGRANGGVDPAFFAIMRFPLKKARLVFILFFKKIPFKKTVWSRHLFLFYFKRKKTK